MFQPRFAPLVAAGHKRQTFRLRARCKPGDELSLRKWQGLPYRSRQEQLRANTRCTNVRVIVLYLVDDHLQITSDDRPLMYPDDFARADGFSSATEMREWIESTHGLPCTGELIEWD